MSRLLTALHLLRRSELCSAVGAFPHALLLRLVVNRRATLRAGSWSPLISGHVALTAQVSFWKRSAAVTAVVREICSEITADAGLSGVVSP